MGESTGAGRSGWQGVVVDKVNVHRGGTWDKNQRGHLYD